jgi:hypothetical protein
MRKGLAILLAAISIIALATAASADLIVTDETNFKNALAAGYYLEDFDGFTNTGAGITPPVGFSGGSTFSYNITTLSEGPSTLYPLDGALSTFFQNDTLVVNNLTGTTTVNAVGGFFFPTDDGGNFVQGSVFVSFNGGAAQEVTFTDPLSFLGFLSDTPITSISIYQTTDVNFPTLDHLYVGTQADVAAVPVPPSVLLLGSGILSLGLLGWRRQNG